MGEPQNENDLFFVCGLIEYIARKTKNTKKYVIQKLGKEKIQKIYNLAEVYHSENIEKVSDELIEETKIEMGTYDTIIICKYRVPITILILWQFYFCSICKVIYSTQARKDNI